jgi:hypothetical protein
MAIKVAVAEEDQKWLAKNGARLLDNPTPLDLYNAWKSLAKKLAKPEAPRAGGDDDPGNAIDTNPTAPAGAARPLTPVTPLPRDRSGELELIREKSRLLAQQITLEDKRRKSNYWKSVAAGRVAPPPRMEITPPKVAARRVYCQLHGTTHETWPCEEVKRIAAEMKAPIPEARYVTT